MPLYLSLTVCYKKTKKGVFSSEFELKCGLDQNNQDGAILANHRFKRKMSMLYKTMCDLMMTLQGDSGGPLSCRSDVDGRWYVQGKTCVYNNTSMASHIY